MKRKAPNALSFGTSSNLRLNFGLFRGSRNGALSRQNFLSVRFKYSGIIFIVFKYKFIY